MKIAETSVELFEFWANHSRTIEIPKRFRQATETALREEKWTEVAELFRTGSFIGNDGNFVIVGPYRTLRQGTERVEGLGICGRVLPRPDFAPLKEVAAEWFGNPLETVTPILPVEVLFSTNGSGEKTEAFIVPDGWKFDGSEYGPALNDMREQRRRFEEGGKPALRRIFEPATAELVLNALEGVKAGGDTRHREFSYHEIGHATGFGLKRKLREGVLATPWYRAVEEWRADGIAFELMAKTLSIEEAGRTIAANLALRFGVDALRGGGMERDTDVGASLLSFDRFFRSGAFRIGPNRKLELVRCTYPGLLQATEKMRHDTLHITREETQLRFVQGIWTLYGSVEVNAGLRRLFQGMVIDPCEGIFSQLL